MPETPTSTLSYGLKTDIGRVRKANQDSLAALSSDQLAGQADGLFVVADGMGGRAGGEVASRVTVEIVPSMVRDLLAERNGNPPEAALRSALGEAMVAANNAVYRQAKANPELNGMGTTCVAALIAGRTAAIGNLGDSRIYLVRDGSMRAVTHDHSLVAEHVLAGDLTQEEARRSRYRNVITRAVGIVMNVTPDVELIELEDGDTLLLCSDGLTNMVGEPAIRRILATEPDVQRACDLLVERALEAGGRDNVTTIVVRRGPFTPVDLPEELETQSSSLGHIDEIQRRSSRRSGGRTSTPVKVLNALILIALGAAGALFAERLRSSTAPPTPKAPVHSAPALDFGKLDYDTSRLLTKVTVRGAPISCDAEGHVYAVTATGYLRWFDAVGKPHGNFGAKLTDHGNTAAWQMATDSAGYVYLVERDSRQIAKYNPKGIRVKLIGSGELTRPEAVAVDAKGNLYVVDAGLIKVFKAKPAYDTAAETGHAP